MKTYLILLIATLALFVSCSSGKSQSNVSVESNIQTAQVESSRSIASEKATIEQWKGDNGLKFVYRSENGQFKSWGTLSFDTWSDDEESVWSARLANGKFVTGYKGHTEKFDVGTGKEELRVVIRNKNGQFVTWKSLDKLVSSQFDSWDINGDGDKETVYGLRYNGKFLNWAPATLEKWENFKKPVLVVRDSADGENNGKLLAWIAPAIYKSGPNKGKAYYKDPETGKFVSPNN